MLVLCALFCIVACDGTEKFDPAKKSEGVMTYAEYDAAAMDAEVVIEAYVQATQSWWDNKITAYLQDPDGAYFAYEMACSEEDAAKLVPGVKIRVTGFKAAWAGEVEIVDAKFTFVDGADTYVADPIDLSATLINADELIKYQNQLAIFKGLSIVSIEYKNGEPGDDIYVTVSHAGEEFSFCVERYLTGPETDVYKAFATLKAGDKVNITGFVYWYNGVNTHITAVEPCDYTTYDEYARAEIDSEVIIEAYVQATQSWWDNKITVYLQDREGGYFAYEMACSEEDAAKLVPGTKIRINGYKAAWAGENEIVDATFTFVKNAAPYIVAPVDLTHVLADEAELIKYQNQLALFRNLIIEKIEYKNGEPGDDIYVTVKQGDKTFSFCVERYLTGPETAIYKAFETLKVGDKIDVVGFVYWYNGVNTHIVEVSAPITYMSYYEYAAAELEAEVVIEAYVQATQSWWDNKITVYLQDKDGAYLAYEMRCTEEDAAKLVPGTRIRVTGYKGEWSGEVEIIDATFTFVEDADTYVASPVDLTSVLSNEAELIKFQNRLAIFKDLEIAKIEYKNGEPGDDIYVTFKQGEATFDFCVERYLTGPETDLYKSFETLKVGDKVDVIGFVYWYNGINTHITGITAK